MILTIDKELFNEKYENIVSYLHGKYGRVKYNYFDENGFFNKKNKISEFLQIHHIEGINKEYYKPVNKQQKTEYTQQDFHKAKNLVYCNYLEHLLLHVKIFQETGKGRETLTKIMIPRLIDFFSYAPHNYFANSDLKAISFINLKDFYHLLKYIYDNTNILYIEMHNSYLEKYGTERWKKGRKYVIKNDWTREKNYTFWNNFLNWKQKYDNINNVN